MTNIHVPSALRTALYVDGKHHSLKDVAAAGAWKDTETLLTCYQQPDADTLLAVVSEPKKTRWGGEVQGRQPMRLNRGPSYDTKWQSPGVLGIGVVTAVPKINRVS